MEASAFAGVCVCVCLLDEKPRWDCPGGSGGGGDALAAVTVDLDAAGFYLAYGQPACNPAVSQGTATTT